MFEKDLTTVVLLDFYGDLLSERQRMMMELYYADDLSLAEIAENQGISRQGVRDSVKRAELQLFDMEERLGIVQRIKVIGTSLDTISRYADNIQNHAVETDDAALKEDIHQLILLVDKLKQTIM